MFGCGGFCVCLVGWVSGGFDYVYYLFWVVLSIVVWLFWIN